MDAAVVLKDEPASVLNKFRLHCTQEVVILKQFLTLLELLLGTRKVGLDEEIFQELCNRRNVKM